MKDRQTLEHFLRFVLHIIIFLVTSNFYCRLFFYHLIGTTDEENMTWSFWRATWEFKKVCQQVLYETDTRWKTQALLEGGGCVIACSSETIRGFFPTNYLKRFRAFRPAGTPQKCRFSLILSETNYKRQYVIFYRLFHCSNTRRCWHIIWFCQKNWRTRELVH